MKLSPVLGWGSAVKVWVRGRATEPLALCLDVGPKAYLRSGCLLMPLGKWPGESARVKFPRKFVGAEPCAQQASQGLQAPLGVKTNSQSSALPPTAFTSQIGKGTAREEREGRRKYSSLEIFDSSGRCGRLGVRKPCRFPGCPSIGG